MDKISVTVFNGKPRGNQSFGVFPTPLGIRFVCKLGLKDIPNSIDLVDIHCI